MKSNIFSAEEWCHSERCSMFCTPGVTHHAGADGGIQPEVSQSQETKVQNAEMIPLDLRVKQWCIINRVYSGVTSCYILLPTNFSGTTRIPEIISSNVGACHEGIGWRSMVVASPFSFETSFRQVSVNLQTWIMHTLQTDRCDIQSTWCVLMYSVDIFCIFPFSPWWRTRAQ